ncbi:MAG: hypothetical protein WA747_03020 [Steroidobacteraceae bacterium]
MNTITDFSMPSHDNVFGRHLSLEALRERAPAVFAPSAHGRVSPKYTFIPSSRVVEGLMERLLPIVLRAKPQGLLFEAANPRHAHEWAVFRDAKIPEGKVLIPGLLATTTNYIEHPQLVAERIERFAQIVGRERVMAGTDCGFGTFVQNFL